MLPCTSMEACSHEKVEHGEPKPKLKQVLPVPFSVRKICQSAAARAGLGVSRTTADNSRMARL
jgi:hypothetical protein